MGITVKHGKPSTIISAAKRAGKAKAAQRASEQAMAAAARLREKQQDMEYRMTLRQQDIAIDLQMQERAKQWEIQKMELRSQIDFQREEKQRQRKLDSYDNVDAELDKQVLSGNVSEEDVKLYRLKNDLARQGMNVSISELRQQQEDRFGVRPYWMRGRDAPEGTPERQLYEAKLAEGISGVRTGTVPWDLDPRYIRTAAAEESRVNRGIFLEPEDIDEFMGMGTAGLPLGDKQLDIGVRTDQPELIFKGYGEREPGTLDAATARQILAEAGGDRDKARQIARQRGYSF